MLTDAMPFMAGARVSMTITRRYRRAPHRARNGNLLPMRAKKKRRVFIGRVTGISRTEEVRP